MAFLAFLAVLLAHQFVGRISTSIVRFWHGAREASNPLGGDEAVSVGRPGASNESVKRVYASKSKENHVDASGRHHECDRPDNETR